MPHCIYPSSYVCDCGHQLDFCEGTVREMQKESMKKRCGIGEGDDRHAVIFDKGDWVAIFCPKAGRAIPNPECAPSPHPKRPSAKPKFTRRQGQVLAFIHCYTKVNRRPPAEADIAAHFGVTAPNAHGLVVTLSKRGLISRRPFEARSIQLLVAPELLPELG